MKKGKQILAIIGIILLVVLYLSTLVCAITDNTGTMKKSGTVIVGKKVGRNDPCPCGSGKKYKFCCGKNK